MKTILFTNHYSGLPLEILYDELPEGFQVQFINQTDERDICVQIANADYLLAGGRTRITEEVIKSANNLKMIQRSGVGLDSLDLDAIKRSRIPLYVNQGVNAESVAEHTLLLMLACLRRLTEIHQNTVKGIWKKQEQGIQTSELRGKTIGIIGMGNIAQTLVSLLKPFHVDILYQNLFQMPDEYEKENEMRFVDLETLLQNSDVVTIHCALTDDTRNLINTKTISRMKHGAILINTARGGIVDTAALAEALTTGTLSFAGLDVHEKEPIPEDYPLKDVKNVILTPHIAGVTMDSFRTMMHDAFRNIDCFEHGQFAEIEAFRYL